MNPNLKDLEHDLDRTRDRVTALERMEKLHSLLIAILAGAIVLVWTLLK